MRRLRRTLRPFGARLTVDTAVPEALPALAAAVARFPRNAGAGGAFTLTVDRVPDAPGDPAWPRTTTAWDGTVLELRCGSARLSVDAATGSAHVSVPPALAAIPDAMRMLVEGAVSSLLIGAGQLVALHSGLVVVGGRGLLLRGPSGAGKSTLTYACLRAGYPIASDDWVYGVRGHSAGWLWGYPWRMFMVQGSERHFPELAGVAPVPHPGSDLVKLPIQPAQPQRRVGATVHAVVLLDPDRRGSIEPVSSAEARDRFWAPALPTERTDLPAPWVEELLARPCFVLRRGTDPAAAVDHLRRVASSL